MYKFWNALKSKLTWYLVGCVIIAGVVSIGCGYVLFFFGQSFIETQYDDPEFNKAFQKKYVKDLQKYIYDNGITLDNIKEITGWTDKNYQVYLALYQNSKVIFSSDRTCYDEDEKEDIDYDEEELSDLETLFQIEMADGTVASADIFCYDYWQYYHYVWIMSVAVGIALFIKILIKMLGKKLAYINQLEKELQILEGGNLEYPITIKGNDEIGNLARGIEQMRLSIIENMKKERLLLQSNKDLVTELSHDLRTPLTTLTGYLEILNMNIGKDQEQREHYLELSLAKTREIKELSDELFEYFLIYGEDKKKFEVEEVPANMLVEDLIENQFLCLEEEGFQLQNVNYIDENTGNCRINAKYMQRVLNNILSNLDKYADKEKPIEVSAMKEQNYLIIRVRNGIRKNLDTHDSTKIGLITCERIMKLHQGEFQKYEVADEFVVKLILPLVC